MEPALWRLKSMDPLLGDVGKGPQVVEGQLALMVCLLKDTLPGLP